MPGRSSSKAAIERIRLRLYEQVNQQIRYLNEAFPEPSGHWRLAGLTLSTQEGYDIMNDFLEIERSIHAQLKRPKQSKGDGGEDEEPTVVKMTNRITVHAKVTLRRPALHST